MKLSVWARREGIHYITAWRWWRTGKLPVPAYQTPSGSVIVSVPDHRPGRTALYARVSSHAQRPELERQVARLTSWGTAHGFRVDEVVTEVSSGLNGKRRKLLALLANPQVTVIIVEHRDRLARFGVEAIRAALAASGRRLIVVEPAEGRTDLIRDMLQVLTLMCGRLYGPRGARTRALAAVKAAKRGA